MQDLGSQAGMDHPNAERIWSLKCFFFKQRGEREVDGIDLLPDLEGLKFGAGWESHSLKIYIYLYCRRSGTKKTPSETEPQTPQNTI